MIFPFTVKARKHLTAQVPGGPLPESGSWITLAGFINKAHADNFAATLNLRKQYDELLIVEATP